MAGGPFASADIYNAEPAELGFYCLCSKRTENDTLPDCPGAAAVARRHAELLTSAGFDYVALDITNWPQVNAATDVAVLRPLEVLFDLWLELRSAGIRTPAIAAWCFSPVGAYADGHETTWQWLLDHVHNNATRAPLLWSRIPGKQSFFLRATTEYNVLKRSPWMRIAWPASACRESLSACTVSHSVSTTLMTSKLSSELTAIGDTEASAAA